MINKTKVINFNYLKLNNLVKEKVYNSMAIQSKIVNTFDLSKAHFNYSKCLGLDF